jgi:hypothetical protein
LTGAFFGHLEHDTPEMLDHLGFDLNQLLTQRSQRPLESFPRVVLIWLCPFWPFQNWYVLVRGLLKK